MGKTKCEVLHADVEKQEFYEQRFNCVVCLEPKLEMVYGNCQHKLCTDCLYVNKILRSNMHKCPICGRINSFPLILPDIPDDNIENQKCLGITQCCHRDRGCTVTLWKWELEDHLKTCQGQSEDIVCAKRKKKSPVKLRVRRKLLSDPVRRSPRLLKK
ncbi:TNF receptor-associated factor 6-B-like [Biomphalaria glabrata]|uniref:TNF receptor-associated factor 6-B-like n=1 Tax=Biomphalaria glabrata TaxID=6526 RepID=A0A9U8E660_BIOGL|nr:TNF receptor-associated factor 6-B-like [Biomphalaria glabrata]